MRDRSVTYSSDIVFSAVADPTRHAVDLLRVARLPAGQIAEVFPISRPAISKQVRYLRRGHLVNETRVSRQRVYELNVAPLKSVDAPLNQYSKFLGDKPDVSQDCCREREGEEKVNKPEGKTIGWRNAIWP